MTELSELLNTAKGDRSVDLWIADAEKRHKVEINKTARAGIYKALRGEHAKNPRDESLRLWAMVFNLDVRKLRQAADKPAGELGPWMPTAESAQLDRRQRRALDNLIKSIVQGGEDHGERPTNDAPDIGPGSPRRPQPVAAWEQDVAARNDPKGPNLENDQQ